MRSLFISKNFNDLSTALIDFHTKHQLKINAHSFLSFESIPFEIPEFDIVFFTSPRSVEFAHNCIEEKRQIACVGTKTAETLKQKGFSADYIVSQTADLNEASQKFASWTNGRKVFFPCSDISKMSFSKYLSENQFTSKVVYKTIVNSQKIEQSDILVFSSPSNVRGFLQENIFSDETIIAWGESTSNELKKNGKDNHIILTEPSQKELIDVLSKLI